MEGKGDGGESAAQIPDGYNLNLDINADLDGASTGTTGTTSSNSSPRVGVEGSPSTRPRFIWDGEDPFEYGPGMGRGWLRISDDSVRECGIESVLAEGSSAFMLYYERVVVDVPGVYPSRRASEECGSDGRDRVGVPSGVEIGDAIGRKAGRESEETLRPRTKTIVMNGSADTLTTEVGVGVMTKRERPPISISTEGSSSGKLGLEPRIIRSVDAGRKKSVPPSTAPSPTETTSEGTFVSPSASTSTLVSREQSTVSSASSSDETPVPRISTPITHSSKSINGSNSRVEDRYHGQRLNGTHSLPHAHIHPYPNPNLSSLPFPTPPHAPVEAPSSSSSTPTQNSPPQSSSPSSSSPSRPKPNTLKRKSKHSHSAGKKPPSVQLGLF